MPQLDQLFAKPGVPAFSGPQCWEGTVVHLDGSGTYIVIETFDGRLRWGPCQPPGAAVTVGDRVSVAMSQDGVLWLLGGAGGGVGDVGPPGPAGPPGPKGDPGADRPDGADRADPARKASPGRPARKARAARPAPPARPARRDRRATPARLAPPAPPASAMRRRPSAPCSRSPARPRCRPATSSAMARR